MEKHYEKQQARLKRTEYLRKLKQYKEEGLLPMSDRFFNLV